MKQTLWCADLRKGGSFRLKELNSATVDFEIKMYRHEPSVLLRARSIFHSDAVPCTVFHGSLNEVRGDDDATLQPRALRFRELSLSAGNGQGSTTSEWNMENAFELHHDLFRSARHEIIIPRAAQPEIEHFADCPPR